MNLKKFVLEGNPVCRKEAVIVGDHFRITMLTTALIRFEYSEDGGFEDRATQMVCNRDFPVPEFRVSDGGEELHIYTKDLEIHYDRQKFSPSGLMIRVAGGKASERVWHYGDEPKDLLGTARTLDEADGEIPLSHGIMSRNGFSVLDDSHTMAMGEDGMVEPRQGNRADFYFFGYGHRYVECLQDFYRLCGKTPLLPRYTFGNWWSRYHKYTETEYKELVERFEKEEVPFSVAVVDMDWHLVEDVPPVYGSGWTGYTWNKKFFPNPPEFMDWLHKHGYKITLNVHPADGVRAYEEAYPRVAEKMGIDPASKEPVLFDMTDPKFIETYFEELHHPMEEEGVDFWWLDWQQGTVTKVPGLDPLWMLNHYHYLDSKWKGKRALTFSRYAGPGSHRYPVGFSGDTFITWESLKFQPYFTANASNIGFGWWSHDIGGHMFGYRDDELTARWVQLGVFSPMNRLHSTDNPFNGKEPWKYNQIVETVMKNFLKLRHKLVPYLYTMNRRASRAGLPLVQPMYYLEPEREETYEVPNNYYFGTEMMVSPITDKLDPVTGLAGAKTWIPQGIWYDFFNGRAYKGGRKVNLWRDIYEMPVLVREGSIIPLKDMEGYDNSIENPEKLEVLVYPGKSGEFVLWEDGGDTPEDLDENWVSTRMTKTADENGTVFIVEAAQGNTAVIPQKRSWKIRFCNIQDKPQEVTVNGQVYKDAEFAEDKKLHGTIVILKDVPADAQVKVTFAADAAVYQRDYAEEVYEILEKAQITYAQKTDVYKVVKELGTEAVPVLVSMNLNPSLLGVLMEILTMGI